jgi:HSP20 family molecular chaperone IbpA
LITANPSEITNEPSYSLLQPADRVFDRAFGSLRRHSMAAPPSAPVPSHWTSETPEAFVVKAELPVFQGQIEVNVEDRNVTIGAEFLAEDAPTARRSAGTDRRQGEPRHPCRPVDANATQATHVDGVLQLTLPKIAKANSKQITIQ